MLQALLFAAALGPAQAQDTFAPGALIQDAASIQVTPEGLNAMEAIVPLVVPAQMPIDPIDESITCFGFGLSDAWVGIAVDDLRLVPRTGVLDVEADLTVWLNELGDLFQLDFEAFCVSGDCDMRIAPFPVSVTMPATMQVVTNGEGDNVIDVTLGQITLVNGLDNSHIDPDFNCPITTIEQVIDYIFGVSLIDYILDFAEPVLLLVIDSQRPDIEAQIEDALSAARFEDTIDLAGVPLDVLLEPQQVIITPAGLEILAQGRMDAAQGACMVDRDPGGSLRTDTAIPAISTNPAGTQFALQLSDDIANQGLYAVWRSGLFCYDLSDGGDIELPIPLNTSLLGIIGGEGFDALFPESQPMSIITSPDEVPVVDYEGAHDLTMVLRELGVDFYTDVDYRQARALGIDLEADAGVDLVFDDVTGELVLDVALAQEDFDILPSHNELVKGSDDTISDNFGGVLEVILDLFLGDALQNLSFLLPSLDGVGLTDLSTEGDGDWLAARAGIGPVSYDNSGADNGCGGGCATGALGGAGWLVLGGLALLARRRRR